MKPAASKTGRSSLTCPAILLYVALGVQRKGVRFRFVSNEKKDFYRPRLMATRATDSDGKSVSVGKNVAP